MCNIRIRAKKGKRPGKKGHPTAQNGPIRQVTNWAVSNLIPATTDSPTQSPAQYHRALEGLTTVFGMGPVWPSPSGETSRLQETFNIDACLAQYGGGQSLPPCLDCDGVMSLYDQWLGCATLHDYQVQGGQRQTRTYEACGRPRDIENPRRGPSADAHWNQQIEGWFAQFGERRWQRVAMLQTGFNDFARQPLRDFDCFHDAPAFGNQPGHIPTGGHIPALSQRLKMQANRGLVDLGDSFLPPRARCCFICHPLFTSIYLTILAHSTRCGIWHLLFGAPGLAVRPSTACLPEASGKQNGPAQCWAVLTNLIPATTDSPTQSPAQYHGPWRA